MIENSHAVVMSRFVGLTVQEMETLRRGLRDADARIIVAKKTLMKRALSEMARPIPEDAFDGPIGFVFLGEDIGAGAKALKAFIKEVGKERFSLTGGILGDTILDEAGATALADLPTKDVMRAMLISTITAPMTSLLGLITAPQRDLVGILQARIDKEGGEGEAEAA
ncbi:MAG TPA: 50S ribosomal protein L10 [Anaerolineae bacterium]|nr:50S ribosomal protein L10 [Anaerolineae bacterium]HIQ11917.1 50S ribosomal protein L10 [Caldilineales bacterium]